MIKHRASEPRATRNSTQLKIHLTHNKSGWLYLAVPDRSQVENDDEFDMQEESPLGFSTMLPSRSPP